MNPVWHFLNGVPNIGPLSITQTQVLVGDGSEAAPALAPSSAATKGIWFSGNNIMFNGEAATRNGFIGPTGITANALILDETNQDVTLSRAAADVITTPDRFVSTGPLAGIGYATGAGGTVAQGSGSGKATTVVLNTVTGTITMDGAALNAGVIVSFTLTNSAVAATDQVQIQHVSGGTVGSYTVTAVGGVGSATVYVRNATAGNLSEAIVLKFMVFKSVTS